MTDKEYTKVLIAQSIDDLVSDLLYYDRREDEELTEKRIDDAFKDGIITIDEAVYMFTLSIKIRLEDEENL